MQINKFEGAGFWPKNTQVRHFWSINMTSNGKKLQKSGNTAPDKESGNTALDKESIVELIKTVFKEELAKQQQQI